MECCQKLAKVRNLCQRGHCTFRNDHPWYDREKLPPEESNYLHAHYAQSRLACSYKAGCWFGFVTRIFEKDKIIRECSHAQQEANKEPFRQETGRHRSRNTAGNAWSKSKCSSIIWSSSADCCCCLKPDINERFVDACENGDCSTVSTILQNVKDFNIEVTDNLGRTALRLAVENEHLEVIWGRLLTWTQGCARSSLLAHSTVQRLCKSFWPNRIARRSGTPFCSPFSSVTLK